MGFIKYADIVTAKLGFQTCSIIIIVLVVKINFSMSFVVAIMVIANVHAAIEKESFLRQN